MPISRDCSTTPEAWLAAQLENRVEFPSGIPTLIDGVDDLEDGLVLN